MKAAKAKSTKQPRLKIVASFPRRPEARKALGITRRRNYAGRKVAEAAHDTQENRYQPDRRHEARHKRASQKVAEFAQGHYLPNFVQSVFNAVRPAEGFGGLTLVVGGDGRYYNAEAIQTVIRIAAANGFGRALVGAGGILSTPAASCVIRKHKAFGGLILSASHNPGGRDGDFGIKFNAANGGPAFEKITDAIYAETLKISGILTLDTPDVDLSRTGSHRVGEMQAEVFDPVADYVGLMRELFDFDALRAAFASGLRLTFDAMHAVTGPYAHAIFERELGAPAGTVKNGTPLPDFGGHHPDPNLVHAKELLDLMMGPDAPDLGAASDGDGDRNLIIGRGIFISPSDSLAMLAANAASGAGLSRRHRGRGALDAHQRRRGSRCREARRALLRDAHGLEVLRQSARRGAHHALWRGKRRHRQQPCARERRRLGRAALAQRHRGAAAERGGNRAGALGHLRAQLLHPPRLRGHRHARRAGAYEGAWRAASRPRRTSVGGRLVAKADDFSYTDPVDGSVSKNQGLRVIFEDGARIVYRLSGTGTTGATLRVYIERYEADPALLAQDTQAALSDLIGTSRDFARLTEFTGREQADVIT